MGCDIHSYVEVFDGKKWVYDNSLSPFDWRNYGVFGFLAGVRNYSNIKPIHEPKGEPNDPSDFVKDEFEFWRYDLHSASYLTLKELSDFDYEQEITDCRTTIQTGLNSFYGGATCHPDHGKKQKLSDFLGAGFMTDLNELRDKFPDQDNTRIVFFFDN